MLTAKKSSGKWWNSCSVNHTQADGFRSARECLHDLPRALSSQEFPTGTGEPWRSSTVTHLTKTCAGLRPSRHPGSRPSHPSTCQGSGGTQCGRQTWAASRRSPLLRGPLPTLANGPCRSLEWRANSIMVVDKVRGAGAIPSVSITGQRCCAAVMFLPYSKGDAVSYIIREQKAWLGVGGGWEEVGSSCPLETETP